MTGAGAPWRMPVAEPIRVILDAQAVEISSARGLAGLGVPGDGSAYRARADGELTAWALVR